MAGKHILKQISQGDANYDISVDFQEDGFDMVIFQEDSALSAKVSMVDLEKQAKLVRKKTKEYYKLLQDFFSDTPPDNVQFKYVSDQTFTVFLDSKIKYFTCKLKKDSYHRCVSSLINKFYLEKTEGEYNLVSLREENNRLEMQIEEMEAQMHDLVEEKRTMEKEMYNSFVTVLNEKKMQIQHQNELLQAFRKGRSTENPTVLVKRRARKNIKTKEAKPEIKNAVSCSDSDESYVTDEDRQYDNLLSTQDVEMLKNDPDFLSEDDSIEFSLPKRQKTAVSTDVTFMPSTSSQIKREPEEKLKLEETLENSPTVELNTQEYLDVLLD